MAKLMWSVLLFWHIRTRFFCRIKDLLVTLYAIDKLSLTARQLWTSSVNLKVFTGLRAPINHMNRACVDWLTVTNDTFASRSHDLSYTSLPIWKSWWKSWWEHALQTWVLFLANCLLTCLLTVFVPFTHTSLSLPTLICHVKVSTWKKKTKTKPWCFGWPLLWCCSPTLWKDQLG